MIELSRKFDRLVKEARLSAKKKPSWSKFLEGEQKVCTHNMSLGRDSMDNPSHSRCDHCGYTEWFR